MNYQYSLEVAQKEKKLAEAKFITRMARKLVFGAENQLFVGPETHMLLLYTGGSYEPESSIMHVSQDYTDSDEFLMTATALPGRSLEKAMIDKNGLSRNLLGPMLIRLLYCMGYETSLGLRDMRNIVVREIEDSGTHYAETVENLDGRQKYPDESVC